ncbi:MAG: phosphatidylserine/phosphatidylglycerophosphate/cardiolipin synthase family protein, partial [Proteobacteria bacterium]
FISNQNPYAELDMSAAPRLRAVFVSTLVYCADFYGTVLARLLKFHADRGALVHVVTTEYMMLPKDRRLLHSLAAQSGNFRLQEFRYYDPDSLITKPLRYIDSKYRDMHIKMFVTLSAEREQDNRIILGGRNVHDGFLFTTKPDHAKYPSLVQYGTDDDFVHWNDFEMMVTSRELAALSFAHLMNFWNRDAYTQKVQPFAEDTSTTANANATTDADKAPANGASLASPQLSATAKFAKVQSPAQMREFFSIPYNDGQTLEELYVSLIDRAKSKIELSTPYLRPTKMIMRALDRAALRNVDITIQTRISLAGDTQAWLYEEVNKESINRLVKKVKIYEWKENSILHSKFILIDGKVGFLGSVNLSRRSFIQDIENGWVIRDPKFVSEMSALFQTYLAKSVLVSEAQARKWFPSLLIQILQNQF